MSHANATNPLLGSVLQQAGLVSEAQINAALEEQRETQLRIGEILAGHGWIKQESAEFFALDWPQVKHQPQEIGIYLQQAALLDQDQVKSILAQQRRDGLQFGTLAVMSGWVNRQTVDFFLKHAALLSEASKTADLEDRAQRISDKFSSSQLSQSEVNPFTLLLLYQQIVQQGSVPVDESLEQAELLNVGLVQRDGDALTLVQNEANGDPVMESLIADSDLAHRPYDRIRLRLLNLEACSARPYGVLAEVLSWTGNQPELTQKLCQAIYEIGRFIPAGVETERVSDLVQEHFIQHWQTSTAAEPLRALHQSVIHNQTCSPLNLLELYDQILKRPQRSEDSPEEQELLRLGLIAKHGDVLRVATRIYGLAFDHAWVAQAFQAAAGQTSAAADPAELEALTPKAPTEPLIEFPHRRQPIWLALWGVGIAGLALAGAQIRRSSLQPATTVPTASSESENSAPAGQNSSKASPKPNLKAKLSGVSDAGSEPPQNKARAPVKPVQLGPQSASQPYPNTRTNARPKAQFGSLSRQTQAALPRRNQRTATAPSGEPQSVSESVPVFVVGSSRAEILSNLGPPTWDRQGYYDNSRALLYKGLVSKQIDLGYLLDSSSGKIRQTEMAFDPAVPFSTVQRALKQMLRGSLPASLHSRLQDVRQGQLERYRFVLGGSEGEIHQNEKGWTYLGVWDASFH